MTRAGVVVAGLQIGGMVVLSAVRSWRQYRRTGSTGVRLPDGGPAERAGSLCFVLGLATTTAATVLAAAQPQRPGDRPLVGAAAMIAGMSIAAVAQSGMGDDWRIGVDPDEQTGLVTTGMFDIVRNPIFSGVMLAALGAFVAAPRPRAALGAALSMTGCELQVRLVEEPHLRRLHGRRYTDYSARVGRFVPLVGRR